VYSIAYSQTAFILLFNDHEETHALLGETEDVGGFHRKMSWAEVQVRTSSNWYPTNWLLSFIEFHYGYFNYHIEHHLFPTFKPSLLKKISPVVESVCGKHNIPYISTPFLEVQKSLQEHLAKLGLPRIPADSPNVDLSKLKVDSSRSATGTIMEESRGDV
jgi:fatty acid desaturase